MENSLCLIYEHYSWSYQLLSVAGWPCSNSNVTGGNQTGDVAGIKVIEKLLPAPFLHAWLMLLKH